MARPMVELARKIYKSTPVPALRKLYFGAFCRVMQHRRVRATINGATFDLDLGEMIDVALYLEQYELEVTAALRHYCRPGMTVMDVGANIGAHTLTMGRLVAPGGSVYAFEPTDFAFAKLQHNASLNDAAHIHLVKVALSEHNSERQAVGYRSSWRTSGGRSDAAGVADFVRLDDWCARHGVDRLDVMKIDIDGNEFEALAGGLMLLERTRPVIVIEAVWPHFADPNRNPFVLLSRLGYRFWDAKSHLEYTAVGKIAALFPDGDRGMTVSINVIARPMSLSN